ncbi:MAG: DUF4159 domain-containing protein [Geminicoccaceae bacterium]|nr:MAG: DUF4159 domain-containing protein [Geminicoccaceae bacterium]
MFGLGALAFAQPWLLTALLGLPALWLLLRLVPPPPREVAFPPIQFLLQLTRRETTAQRTPWWLLLLRLAAIACLIVAAARPLLFPADRLAGDGPLVVVVDDGWASAPHWGTVQSRAVTEIDQAEREGREVVLITTAPTVDGIDVRTLGAAAAADRVRAMQPVPWWPDRTATAEAVDALDVRRAPVLWLSDGIARDAEARRAATVLADSLERLGPLRVFAPEASRLAGFLVPLPDADGGLALGWRQVAPSDRPAPSVRAVAGGEDVLARVPLALDAAGLDGLARFALPPSVAERVRRFEREPVASAGDVVLTDQGLGARSIGIVTAGGPREVQPLLAERFFVERALAGRARVTVAGLEDLLAADVPSLVLLDGEELSGPQQDQLRGWIEAGGVLLRFAGPHLADRQTDALVPVRLRFGGRLLDGSLSWSEPLPLGNFSPDGPLAGLPVATDVRVRQQVLAEPSPATTEATLAVLRDGTPLVTGQPLGDGWLMLVHTTANTQWSDLALSGTFVALLERVADMGRGRQTVTADLMQPTTVLDAFGRLVEPDATTRPVPAAALIDGSVGPTRPPGLYSDPTTGAQRAFNLAATDDRPLPLRAVDVRSPLSPLVAAGEVDLRPWLLLAALLLLFIDLAIVGAMRGRRPVLRPQHAALAALAAVLLTSPPAAAFDPVELTEATPLAFVITGDPELDRLAAAGLEGLARQLYRRTSIEPSRPVGVDIARDPLELFPLLFWPIPDAVAPLRADVAERFVAYLESGGMVVFDTRDANMVLPGTAATTPGMERLRTLLRDIELPPLEPVGADHALTKSFFLLQEFPGRFSGQPIWVDRAQPGVNDGVSSVLIGANDWLGAWAVDDFDRPLLPVVPGGERQREWARRAGVNIVMYALTGNYKTDQVHVPTLLERLGQ